MINYRLEMTVDKHIHVANTLVFQHTHAEAQWLPDLQFQFQKGQDVKHMAASSSFLCKFETHLVLWEF